MTKDEEQSTREAKEPVGPEPQTPPMAKKSSGTELMSSEGPRKELAASVAISERKPRPRRPTIEGSRRLTCKRCGHFLFEIRSMDFEAATVCSRCKTENYFAHQELK